MYVQGENRGKKKGHFKEIHRCQTTEYINNEMDSAEEGRKEGYATCGWTHRQRRQEGKENQTNR